MTAALLEHRLAANSDENSIKLIAITSHPPKPSSLEIKGFLFLESLPRLQQRYL
jgi:hypothetical protein